MHSSSNQPFKRCKRAHLCGLRNTSSSVPTGCIDPWASPMAPQSVVLGNGVAGLGAMSGDAANYEQGSVTQVPGPRSEQKRRIQIQTYAACYTVDVEAKMFLVMVTQHASATWSVVTRNHLATEPGEQDAYGLRPRSRAYEEGAGLVTARQPAPWGPISPRYIKD